MVLCTSDGITYEGLDFDARSFRKNNQENIELIKKKIGNILPNFTFHEYILPQSYKGIITLRKYWSIEDFLSSPEESINDYVKELSGYTTDEILKIICVEQMNNRPKINLLPTTRIITREMRYTILKEQKWKCNNCGCVLKFNHQSDWIGEVAHIDHIFPFVRRWEYPNGEEYINERNNLQALCSRCNLQKNKNIN